ncbi:hypothetical protein HY357_01190 [Candidatus Roizmanbacteria bacterium]|nr:hypothetical protein [Candidatus Roizmanbacteria bacterium]
MDIVEFLSSVNKVGLVAFLVTLGFLIYEIYLLKKSSKSPAPPTIPQFEEVGSNITSPSQVVQPEKPPQQRKNVIILSVLIILLVVFGAITLLGYINLKSTSEKKSNVLPSPKKSPITANVTTIPTEKIPSVEPTIFPTVEETIFPTQIVEPSLEPSPSPTEVILTAISPTNYEIFQPTSALNLSPTTISQLPETGYLRNTLIIFSVAGLVIFFSFLF